MHVGSIASEEYAVLSVALGETRFVSEAREPDRIARTKIRSPDGRCVGCNSTERYRLGGGRVSGRIHDGDPVMYAVAADHHEQGASFVHHRDQRSYRWCIKHDLCQHEIVLRRMANEIDPGCTPHLTPSPISSDDIARRKTEGRLAVLAFENNAVRTLPCGFDEVAAPDFHTKFQRPLLEERHGRDLRQQQRKGKARVEHREV